MKNEADSFLGGDASKAIDEAHKRRVGKVAFNASKDDVKATANKVKLRKLRRIQQLEREITGEEEW